MDEHKRVQRRVFGHFGNYFVYIELLGQPFKPKAQNLMGFAQVPPLNYQVLWFYLVESTK